MHCRAAIGSRADAGCLTQVMSVTTTFRSWLSWTVVQGPAREGRWQSFRDSEAGQINSCTPYRVDHARATAGWMRCIGPVRRFRHVAAPAARGWNGLLTGASVASTQPI